MVNNDSGKILSGRDFIRAVHIDLKGCVPPMGRLLRHLELYCSAGFNAVLIEWEDMFPWRDRDLCSAAAYSADQIRQLGRRCSELGLEVIPLVQTLGHLENLLSLPRYAGMREMPGDVGCLNPLHEGAVPLMTDLLGQVLELLPGVRLFHIGGDEASSFGKSDQSAAFIREHGEAELYLHHIGPLCAFLNQRGVRPLVWADMMVSWPEASLECLGQMADLVPWGYQGKVSETRLMANSVWLQKLHERGIALWGGCAYKGADGFNAVIPDLEARIENTQDWVQTARITGMRGLIATGWSRYSTFRPQCETTEAALRELAVVGKMIASGKIPENPEKWADQWIEQQGEKEIFEKLNTVLENFRWIFSEHHRILEQHVATVCSRKLKQCAGPDWYVDLFLESLRNELTEFQKLKAEFLKAVEGILIPECAENYFKERELILKTNLKSAENISEGEA